MKLPVGRVVLSVDIAVLDLAHIASSLSDLVASLKVLQGFTEDVVNSNESFITYVSQAELPDVPVNEIWLWKDSDASPGGSTHYLVANDGNATVTFSSKETIPIPVSASAISFREIV